MAWWDYGIQGRTDSIVKSGALTSPMAGYYNLDAFTPSGSYSLNSNPAEGGEYGVLLCTTSGGTQIYLRLKAFLTSTHAYLPEEDVNVWTYGAHIQLRKNGTTLEPSAWNMGNGLNIIAGEGSIYNYCYRCRSSYGLFDENGKIWDPGFAYPTSKGDGGSTCQVGVISNSSGLRFYAIGFPCVTHTDNIRFSAPCFFIGEISASTLNNLYWFDPDSDSLSEDAYNQIIGGGGTIVPGDRPIDYEYEGDDMTFPSLPTGASALGFGSMKIFHPTSSQLGSALDVLWSDSTETTLESIIESCKKWWYKPEQYCVSLNLMPVDAGGTSARIYFGKYDTEVNAPAITNQYMIVDCGSIQVPLKSGSSFDYGDYVKCMLYLPYIGFRQVNTNEIMGGSIAIKYYVDLFTGVSLCNILVSNSNCNTSVLYTYECNIAQQIPITSENYNTVINALLSASISVASQNYGSAIMQGASAIQNIGSPTVQTSGKMNSNSGALGYEKPYLILHFPVQSLPNGFESQEGFPNSINTLLGNLSGYVEVEKIHLEIPDAYDEDIQSIQRSLKEGVIL